MLTVTNKISRNWYFDFEWPNKVETRLIKSFQMQMLTFIKKGFLEMFHEGRKLIIFRFYLGLAAGFLSNRKDKRGPADARYT